MSKLKHTITQSWPVLKEDLISFLSDTDAWIIGELKNALKAKDWNRISSVIQIMESVHDLSHSH